MKNWTILENTKLIHQRAFFQVPAVLKAFSIFLKWITAGWTRGVATTPYWVDYSTVVQVSVRHRLRPKFQYTKQHKRFEKAFSEPIHNAPVVCCLCRLSETGWNESERVLLNRTDPKARAAAAAPVWGLKRYLKLRCKWRKVCSKWSSPKKVSVQLFLSSGRRLVRCFLTVAT